MPVTYARRDIATPPNITQTTLGYQDQKFNQSNDHLQQLKDYKAQVENTITSK
jgi:hypothetical protein